MAIWHEESVIGAAARSSGGAGPARQGPRTASAGTVPAALAASVVLLAGLTVATTNLLGPRTDAPPATALAPEPQGGDLVGAATPGGPADDGEPTPGAVLGETAARTRSIALRPAVPTDSPGPGATPDPAPTNPPASPTPPRPRRPTRPAPVSPAPQTPQPPPAAGAPDGGSNAGTPPQPPPSGPANPPPATNPPPSPGSGSGSHGGDDDDDSGHDSHDDDRDHGGDDDGGHHHGGDDGHGDRHGQGESHSTGSD